MQYDTDNSDRYEHYKQYKIERRNKMIKDVELKVVGVTFKNEDGTSRQNIIRSMSQGSPVILRREPSNKFDINAITVLFIDSQVGYIGKEYAKILAPMMDSGVKFNARVKIVDKYEGTYYLHIIINQE